MSDYIKELPKELLSDIVARVASSSLSDYFNVKLSCKMLKEAAEESNVYRHVSLDEFPMVAWTDLNETATNFLNRCLATGNPDALYRMGMVEYFSWNNLDGALELLNQAARMGHVGAYYIISIILLYSGGDFIQKGVTLLSAMKISNDYKEKVKFYRKNLIKLLKTMWIRNTRVLRQRPTCCTKNHEVLRRQAWNLPGDDDEAYIFCDDCTCDRELAYIFQVLPPQSS